MIYPIVQLGEVCDFIYGDGLKETDRKGGNDPVYGSNGIVGWHDEAITKGETIIVGRKGSIGEIHLSKVPCWAIDTTYYIDKTKAPCDFTWLYYTLKALDLTRLNKSAAVPGLNREDAYEQKIPLPPLSEQKRIASLLARADRLRQLRRTAYDLGQSLLQSVFLEMFGDVVRNYKGWKIMSLGQTCDEIYRYPTFYGFDYVEEGVPVVRIGDILLHGEVNPNLENYVCIKPEINKRFPRTILELGDILMAVRGDGSTGKRIGLVKSKNLVGANISPNLLRFKANEKHISSSYLFHFMTSNGGQELIDRYITRTAKKTITSTDIQTIKIPVPPLSLQEEFAGVVARVEGLRGRMSEAERQVEGLFESLLAQSFGGTA